jgi:protoporphyrinogen oxidase
MSGKRGVIIGAGPAGLTAAYELLDKTDVQPIVYEASGQLGGLARTVNHNGNRMDVGGHRFFSKSDRVMQWWLNILPLQSLDAEGNTPLSIAYRNSSRTVDCLEAGADPEEVDRVMLVRNRLSRILYGGKLFDYPVSLNATTFKNLGPSRVSRIALSYLRARLLPIRHERNLEDFFINRFGKELYCTFFKDYTEKVWGVSCKQIAPEWGSQRVKGLTLTGAARHALKSAFSKDSSVGQKNTETSLIERFLYPKYGPGQMWEEVARIVEEKGGKVCTNHNVIKLKTSGRRIVSVDVRNELTGELTTQPAAYFISSMPIRDLIEALGESVPPDVAEVARGLVYRGFISIGLLGRKMKLAQGNVVVPDNWIYVQEPDVKVGRIQVFNNWSPYLVADPTTAWIGCEYFCNEGDELWNLPDKELAQLAVEELARIQVVDPEDILDYVVLRDSKAYPAYSGTYHRLDTVRRFVDQFENLFLVGRNGMHHYNNQDHSMLTAITAVENIANGIAAKDNIWRVNTEQEYHEST